MDDLERAVAVYREALAARREARTDHAEARARLRDIEYSVEACDSALAKARIALLKIAGGENYIDADIP